jgi:hypothetical protein
MWREKPVIVSACLWWFGFCWATLLRRPRLIPADLHAFVRNEQRQRLARSLRLSR